MNLDEIKHIERVTVGRSSPEQNLTEEDIQKQMDRVNVLLANRGQIIGTDKNATVLQVGEHQMVLQTVTYHIGFKRFNG